MTTRTHSTGTLRLVASLALALVAVSGMAFTAEDEKKAFKGDAFPLDTCVVTGEALGSMGDPIILNHEGREIRLCCKGCVKKFKNDTDTYIAKIDAEIIKQQLKYYPLGTCVVMEEEVLGSEDMGEPVDKVYKNRLVRFCCKGCVRKFKKDPATYIARIDQAVIKQQLEDYPMTNCVVEPDYDLGADTINYVYANRLVRLGGKGCIKKFNANPNLYLAKLDKAAMKK